MKTGEGLDLRTGKHSEWSQEQEGELRECSWLQLAHILPWEAPLLRLPLLQILEETPLSY